MTTGDIKNNVRKLTAALKGIKYEEANVESLSKGLAASYLPIYHYVFRDYSRHLAEQIAEIKVELYGKSDVRFVESMYKLLRELFSYKPPLTKEQFFANGFAERKVIMCTEILNLARERHKSLAPKTVKQRPASGPLSGNISFRGSKTDSTRPAVPVQSAATQPSQSTAKSQTSVTAALDKSRSSKSTAKSQTSVTAALDKSSSSNPTEQASKVYTPVVGESSVASYNPSFYQSSHIESFMSQSQSCDGDRGRSSSIVEVVSLKEEVPRVIKQTANVVNNAEQLRPIDIVAMTPRKPPGNESAPVQVQVDENAKLQHFHELNERLVSIENRLSKLEDYISRTEQKEQDHETILARLTLLENWVSMFELQSKTQTGNKPGMIAPSPVCNDASQAQAATLEDGPTTSTPTKTKSAVNDSDMSELPACLVRRMEDKLDEMMKNKIFQQENFSKVTEVNSDTVCSSEKVREDVESTEPVILEVSSGTLAPTADDHNQQAERIKQMFKETENLLNIAVDSPAPAKNH